MSNRDYEKELLNMKSLTSAGLGHDFKKHIVEGFGFWYGTDVFRHLLGKQNVYGTYYDRIERAFFGQIPDSPVDVALEAAEYARQKRDLLQFWGFLMEGAIIAGDDNKIMEITMDTCDYCFEQGKANPPKWLYIHGLQICEIAFAKLKSQKTRGEAHKYFLILYHLSFFLMDVDEATNQRKLLEEDLYYVALVAKYGIAFLKRGSSERDVEEYMMNTLSIVQETSSNPNAIWARIKMDKSPF